MIDPKGQEASGPMLRSQMTTTMTTIRRKNISVFQAGQRHCRVDLQPSGSITFFIFFTGKAEPEAEASSSGKTFTRKKPVDKPRNELGQVAMEIKPTDQGT